MVEESEINLLEMAEKLAIMLLIASHLGPIPAPATISKLLEINQSAPGCSAAIGPWKRECVDFPDTLSNRFSTAR